MDYFPFWGLCLTLYLALFDNSLGQSQIADTLPKCDFAVVGKESGQTYSGGKSGTPGSLLFYSLLTFEGIVCNSKALLICHPVAMTLSYPSLTVAYQNCYASACY